MVRRIDDSKAKTRKTLANPKFNHRVRSRNIVGCKEPAKNSGWTLRTAFPTKSNRSELF